MNIGTGRLVLITWLDACSIASRGNWTDKDELDKAEIQSCKSVGWVHRETDDHVVLFAHDAGDQCGGDFCIPKCCITHVQYLAIADLAVVQ